MKKIKLVKMIIDKRNALLNIEIRKGVMFVAAKKKSKSEMKREKAMKGEPMHAEPSMPKKADKKEKQPEFAEIKLNSTEPVEFNLNGKMFAAEPAKVMVEVDGQVLKVPFAEKEAFEERVKAAFGNIIVE